MRVLHIITGLRRSGAEVVLLSLAQEFNSVGIPQLILTMRGEDELVAEFRASGISVLALNLHRPLRGVMGFVRGVRAIREFRPDICQSWMYHANSLAALLHMANVIKAPVCWGIHNSPAALAERPRTRVIVATSRWLSHLASRIVYCFERGIEEYSKIGYPEKLGTVIPNGIQQDRFLFDVHARGALRTQMKIASDVCIVGHVARYHPQKDHRSFLEALAKSGVVTQRCVAILVGRGTTADNGELMELVRRLELTHAIRLVGPVGNTAPYLSAFDVLCQSSRSGEAAPLSLLEAQAAGLEIITTDVGDSARLAGATGKVVPAGDVDALSAAIKDSVVAFHSRIMPSVERVSTLPREYTVRVMAKKYADLYQSLAPR